MAKRVAAATLSIELVAEIARLQTGLDKAKKAVSSASGTIARDAKAANDNLRNIGNGAGGGLKDFSRKFGNLGSTIGGNISRDIRGGLNQAASQVPILGDALARLSGPALVAGAAIGLLVATLGKGLAEAESFGRAVRGLDAVLRATGNSTGVSRDELISYAERMETVWAITAEEILKAQQVLSSFAGVAGSTFERAIAGAADMSAVFGGDLSSNVEKLGTVLQNLAQGEVTGLSKGFKFLGVEALNSIARLAETGRTAEAQVALLDLLEKKVGGAQKADAKGLSGAFFKLNDAIGDFLRNLTVSSGAYDGAVGFLDRLTAAVTRSTEAYQKLGLAGLFALKIADPSKRKPSVGVAGPGGSLTVALDPSPKNSGQEIARRSAEQAYKTAEAARQAEKAIEAAKKAAISYGSEQKKATADALRAQKEIQALYEKLRGDLDPELAKRADFDQTIADIKRVMAAGFINQATADAWAQEALDKLRTALGLKIKVVPLELFPVDMEKLRRDIAKATGFKTDLERKADQDARDRALQAANDVADIVGGRIGQAISQLAAALDRFAAIEISSGKGGKGLGKAFSKISKELGETLQAAAAGAQVGSAVSGIMKGLGIKTSKTGAEVGGAIGGAVGGPIGALAGSIIGGTIGGMLKGVKKASATIELTAGKATMGILSGNSAGLKKAASAMAGSLITGLVRIADELGGMIGDGIKVSIGQRDKTFRVDLEGLGRTKGMPKFSTEKEAIAFAIQEVIRRGAIIGLRAGTLALVKGEGELEAQLGKALKFENVFKELARIANPVIAGIDAIAKEFTALIDIFEEAGATVEDYAKLQELMAIKQKEAIEEAFEPIRTMLDDLKAKADTAGEAVRTAFEEVLGREGAAIQAYEDAFAAQAQAQAEAMTTGFADEIARITAAIRPLRNEATALAATADRLRDFSAGLAGELGGNIRFSASAATAAAQAGDVDTLGRLRDAAMAGATDRFSQIRNLAILRNAATGAAGGFAGRASTIEVQIALMEQQVSGIEQQVKALEAIDKSTIDIAKLISDMETAKSAADVAREQMAKLTELTATEISFGDAVAAYETAKAVRDDLIRNITAAGFANLIEVQRQTGAQVLAAVAEVAARAAAATDAASRAIVAAQAAQATAAANDNMWSTYDIGYGPVSYRTAPATGSMAAEIGAAVAEQVAPALYQIAKNTGKTAITLEDFDRVGMPDVRSL